MSSLKVNFIYKSILTTSTFVSSFIVFPYITRVLGVENIGIINFVDNFINYFILFASMGISILGVREIAIVAKDKEQRSKVFFNILGLNMLFTVSVLIIYTLIIICSPKLSAYKELLYIGIGKILFTALLFEWFFSGIEDFRYISIRSIIIKILYIIAVFTLIRSKEQYILYFILTTSTVILNAISNILYVKQFISFKFFKLFSTQYIKDNIALGIYLVLNSMYSTFNVVYLGFITDNFQVGYYTTAFKLYSIILAFFSAFTSVMLPRMNVVLSEHDSNGFNTLIKKSFSIVYSLCIPLIFFAIIMASNIVNIIAGESYKDAILPMMIIMPTVFMVGLSQILAVQVITPLKKDKVLLIASITGAIFGISLNIILVPYFKCIGSAITLLLSETAVTTVYIIYVKKSHIISLFSGLIIKNILISIPSAAIFYLSTHFIRNDVFSIIIGVIFGGSIWFLLNYNTSNSIIKDLIIKTNK